MRSAARRCASSPPPSARRAPLHHDPEAARAAGYADVVAPPMFAVVYSSRPLRAGRCSTPTWASTSPRMVHGGQEFVWGPPVVAGDEIATEVEVKDIAERGGLALLRVREPLDEPGRRDGLHRHLDQHRPMSALEPGQALPELKVTPDKYLTVRYAGASGDFNPIHIDEEFAQSVGLPGRILHGLWTMAQVARARQRRRRRPGARCAASRSSSAAWASPSRSSTVSASVKDVADGVATVEAEAFQDGRRIIRKGKAELKWADSRPSYNRRVLTPRQELLLGKVVDVFAATGQPVGSKALAADDGDRLRPVDDPQRARGARGARAARAPAHLGRARADRRGLPLLRRPHAARSAARPPSSRASVELTLVRREVDEAMRVTTETLSQVTNLLAIVSAPPIATTTIRHVEVLALQPQVLMVVIITSTGGVSKRVFAFERPVDPGLAEWAAAYLNEQLVGMGLGARMLHSRLDDPTLPPTERAFIDPPRARVHRARRDRRGHAVRRRRRAAAVGVPLPGPVAAQRADGDARAPRRRCSACSPTRSAERDLYVRIGARERHAGAARRSRSSPPTTACRSATSARSR